MNDAPPTLHTIKPSHVWLDRLAPRFGIVVRFGNDPSDAGVVKQPLPPPHGAFALFAKLRRLPFGSFPLNPAELDPNCVIKLGAIAAYSTAEPLYDETLVFIKEFTLPAPNPLPTLASLPRI